MGADSMCHKKVNTVMLSGVHFGFAVRLVSLNTLTFLTEVFYLIQPKELSKDINSTVC